MLSKFAGLLGILVFLSIAWGLSRKRSIFPFRLVAWRLGLQLLFALFILKTPIGTSLFSFANGLVQSFTLATYALCGFVNFASIAIQIGGIGSLAPERRPDLARLGLRSMIAGLLACYLTASMAGLIL